MAWLFPFTANDTNLQQKRNPTLLCFYFFAHPNMKFLQIIACIDDQTLPSPQSSKGAQVDHYLRCTSRL